MSTLKIKATWLSRRIAKPGPHLTLCLSQPEFDAVMKQLKVRNPPDFLIPGAHASTHHFENAKGELTSVVSLGYSEERSPIEIAGLLIHEATHVWQEYAAVMGELNPGREQEAYAIQAISQELLAEYARRL